MATTVFMAESNSSCQAAPSGTNATATVPNTQVQGPVFYRCALIIVQTTHPELAHIRLCLTAPGHGAMHKTLGGVERHSLKTVSAHLCVS